MNEKNVWMKKIYQWLKLYKCEAYKGKEIYERKKVCESKFYE